MKSLLAVALMLTSIFTIAACSCANQAKIKFEEYTEEDLKYSNLTYEIMLDKVLEL